jgi:hypothetical protein
MFPENVHDAALDAATGLLSVGALHKPNPVYP